MCTTLSHAVGPRSSAQLDGTSSAENRRLFRQCSGYRQGASPRLEQVALQKVAYGERPSALAQAARPDTWHAGRHNLEPFECHSLLAETYRGVHNRQAARCSGLEVVLGRRGRKPGGVSVQVQLARRLESLALSRTIAARGCVAAHTGGLAASARTRLPASSASRRGDAGQVRGSETPRPHPRDRGSAPPGLRPREKTNPVVRGRAALPSRKSGGESPPQT